MTLPAERNSILHRISANSSQTPYGFAQICLQIPVPAAGRVMTLPYSGRKRKRLFSNLPSQPDKHIIG